MSNDKNNFRSLAETLVEKILLESAHLDAVEVAEELLENHYPEIPTIKEEVGEKVWILYGASAMDQELEGIYDDPAPIVEMFNQQLWDDMKPYKNITEIIDDYDTQNEMEQWVEEFNVTKVKING